MQRTKRAFLHLAFAGVWSCAFLAPKLAQASSGVHYLHIRLRSQFNPQLEPAQVENNPSAYEGAILEIQAKIAGWAQSNDGLYVLLQLKNTPADILSLKVPSNEQNFFAQFQDSGSAPPLRVLLKVLPLDPNSNVPRFRILAAALDEDVQTAEKDSALRAQEQRLKREWEKARWLQAFHRSLPPDLRGNLSARVGDSMAAHPSTSPTSYLPPGLQSYLPPYSAYIASRNPLLSDRDVNLIASCLLSYSYQMGVDPRLTVAMIIAESDFDPKCTSNKGAMGLCQLMPEEVQRYGLTDGYNIAQNLWGGVMELRECLNRYQAYAAPDGSLTDAQIRLAMAAYNAGPGAVQKYGGVPPYKETQDYVRRVLRYYHQLTGTKYTN